jgi:transposase
MDPIELAVKAIEAQGEGEQLSYTKVAEKYNVSRHTGQKMQGHSGPSADQNSQPTTP